MSRKNIKVALDTGASSGMGMDFVKALFKEGMVVYAVARRVEKMRKLEKLGAHTIKMDITNKDDVPAGTPATGPGLGR